MRYVVILSALFIIALFIYWGCENQTTAPVKNEISSSSFSGETDISLSVNASPKWYADARCFLDGPTGSFDDISVKDPSIVYYGGKWHLFYTGRDANMWRMGYATASRIEDLKNAQHVLITSVNAGSYYCAPQVFWFEAKGKWYLIYQSNGACFSTNTDINNPNGWTPVSQMFSASGVDFWCISDGSYVYCFWSPQDGSYTIKRRRTTVANFPYNWEGVTTVCSGTFEAPHVYKNKADGRYYMIVEDINRYFELWTATDLNGTWTKVAEQWAAKSNLVETAEHWTDQVSHGEIIRSGYNEKMEVDNLDHCLILIQGVVNGNYGDYYKIPYDLGLIHNYKY